MRREWLIRTLMIALGLAAAVLLQLVVLPRLGLST